jgi:S-DNA-T family DNA segregation ATPase FtsK/SpoIIIE
VSLLLRGLSRVVSPQLLWPTAAREVGLLGTRAVGCRPTALGWALTLRLRPPATAAVLDAYPEPLATAFGVARVRVAADPARADRATVALDLWPSLGAVAYPQDSRLVWLPRDSATPVPLGLDEDGEEVRLPLYGASLLVAGSPGSGKSTALRAVLAGLAGQRDTALVGIDPKRVELTPWRNRLSSLVVGNEAEPTLRLLRDLVAEVQHRAARLADQGLVAARPDAETPALVLVVDEWAELGAEGTSKQRAEAHELLRRYVSLGRAVGCSAVLATQRPTSDTVDTGTRALLAHRLTLRCGDRWQSEAILGQGNDQAARIPLSSAGWGLLASGPDVRGIQVYGIDPARIAQVHCSALRVGLPWVGCPSGAMSPGVGAE